MINTFGNILQSAYSITSAGSVDTVAVAKM